MALLTGDETLLHVLRHLPVRDGAVASAASVAFRHAVLRTPQLAAVRLLTPKEMMEKEVEVSSMGLDFLDLKDFFTELGRKGQAGYDGVHVLNARISLAGHRSHAEMVLLERRKGLRYNFHEACDAESQDLQVVGTSFCDARGRVRLASVKACGPEVMSGGFLYIDHLGEENSKLFQQPEMGPVVVRKLLQETTLKGRWSLAVVMPSEEELLWFLQAGFVQARELALQGPGVCLFAVPSFLEHQMKSSDEAKRVEIVEPKDLQPMSQINQDLLELVKNEGTEAQISALLKKGASIEDSCAIHCCAFNRSLQHLKMLLRLVPSPEKAVNRPDDCSLLPLMLAVKGACGSLSRQTLSVPTEVCAQLIEARADVSAVDAAGLTALGHLRKELREVRDFDGCFNVFCVEYDGDDLEKLLMPPSGPTAADEQMIDAPSDEGSLDWEEDEEEDFEDDEDFGLPGVPPGVPYFWTNPNSDGDDS